MSVTGPPVVSAVIVSFNTRQMTLDCLAALVTDLGTTPAELWVVDNASTDDSVEAIGAAFPDVKLIANDRNRGFGAANNQAMRQAAGEFILLLNSDAFVKDQAVEKLVSYLRQHPDVGVVGPQLRNADGSLQRSCFRFPSPFRAWVENLWVSAALPNNSLVGDYRQWDHDREREVDWVVGACMLVRRSVFQEVGGFDERFFMYAEETDWQRSVRAAGWKIGFTPDARVVHLGGASGADRSAMNAAFFDSLDLYELKHHGWLGLVLLRLAMVVGSLARLAGWAGVFILSSRRRAQAQAKVRLHSWLLKRQALHRPPEIRVGW